MMASVTTLQFGVNLRAIGNWQEMRRVVHRIDELGYDVVAVPDHLGAPSPFSTLAAVSGISPRLRVRTYVLNAGFWNAALLARDVATLDRLSAGRVEVGLGAGHMKSEHDDAELPWFPLRERVRALEELVVDLRRRLSDGRHQPVPVQQPIPILIGAMSRAGLSVAARHADVVGFSGARQVPGAAIGTFTLSSPQETAERVHQVQVQAGGRPYRSDVLLQVVRLGGDPDVAAAELTRDIPHLTAEQARNSPFVLLARTAEQAVDELLERHERYGFDSVTTHQPSLEPLGQVIAALRARMN
ncbi:MAG: TIGR03621 family F420-dependent LLM class oxidoreductase [Pseudonocardiaceae bacterium]